MVSPNGLRYHRVAPVHDLPATQNPSETGGPAAPRSFPRRLAWRLAVASGLCAAVPLAGLGAYAISSGDAATPLRVLGFVLIVGVAVSALTYRLALRLTQPLARLDVEAGRLAAGQLEGVIELDSADEVAALAQNFNRMASNMKASITELESSNRQLASANVELRELDRVKSDLIANVSHELRTPLTAIKGYTEYVADRKLGAVSERQEKALAVVLRNIERLARSINALLDFSRIEGGRLKLNRQPFALPLLVDHVHQTLRSMIERKSLSFQTRFEVGLPDVLADREQLTQVFENLVINAIKFTPEHGRIEITAKRVRQGDASVVEVSVSDTGVGILPDQASRIFSRFHQVDASSSRRVGGVGLGLAIVKNIVDAHDSTIRVESDPGKLTRFTFTLPVAEVARADEARTPRRAMAVRADSEHP